jgi:hypothetical protein
MRNIHFFLCMVVSVGAIWRIDFFFFLERYVWKCEAGSDWVERDIHSLVFFLAFRAPLPTTLVEICTLHHQMREFISHL